MIEKGNCIGLPKRTASFFLNTICKQPFYLPPLNLQAIPIAIWRDLTPAKQLDFSTI